MDPRPLRKGEIVQIDPAQDNGRGHHWFGGCLMVVTEPKDWGAQGYVQAPGEDAGQAYYRCKFADMEPTGGMTVWIAGGEDEEG